MTLARKSFAALALALFVVAPALAADYPTRAITVVNPFLPGGVVDLAFRPISEELSHALKVNVINSPQPGAGGVVAVSKHMSAKPDGYTLILASDAFFMTNTNFRKVRFSMDDFIPVHSYGVTPMALAVKKDDPRFSTLEEFLAYAKAHPGELSIGQTGMLGVNHVGMARMESELGIKFKTIPYDGALATVGALASGHIDAAISEILYNREIAALALFGDKSEEYPEVPTFRELGYDINWGSNFGVWAIKNTPLEIIETLSKAITLALQKPNIIENLRNLGLGVKGFDSQEWPEVMKPRMAIVMDVIAKGLIVPEK